MLDFELAEIYGYTTTKFNQQVPNLKIQLFHAGGIFHDRYIILDYGTNLEDPDRKKYEPMIKELLKNKKLLLK